MKRIAFGLSVLILSGCVVRTVTAPPPPVAVVPAPEPRAFYYGEHAYPDGGWCYVYGPHEHDFYPQPGNYVYDGSYYYWRAPVVVTYYAGHPLPAHGWCGIAGAHHHDYAPPRDAYWSHVPGRGHVYRGPYTAARPPPRTYWTQPAPPPAHWQRVRSPVPAPVRPEPVVAAPARGALSRSWPQPVADAPERGHSREHRGPTPPRAPGRANAAPVAATPAAAPAASPNGRGRPEMNPRHGQPPPQRAKPETASEARNAPEKEKEKEKKNDRGRREG
jgi:hypothetical protein